MEKRLGVNWSEYGKKGSIESTKKQEEKIQGRVERVRQFIEEVDRPVSPVEISWFLAVGPGATRNYLNRLIENEEIGVIKSLPGSKPKYFLIKPND